MKVQTLPWSAVLIGGSALAFLSGCAALTPAQRLEAANPPQAATPFVPRAEQAPAAPSNAPAPARPDPTKPMGLPELIDFGLSRNADTRAVWLTARSAGAALEAEKGALWPRINGSANVARANAAAGSTVIQRTTYGAGIDLSYLLFDFGGRNAAIEQARQSLLAANWNHNAALADRVLAIATAFYQHQSAQALWTAQKAVVEEAKTGMVAAEERHHAGVATLSEVLQARTAFSKSLLNLATYEGRVSTSRGELATAVGLPAATALEITPLPPPTEPAPLKQELETLTHQAVTQRPELAASQAQVARAEARVRQVRSDGLPQVTVGASAGRTWFAEPSSHYDPYSAAVTLKVPLFTGWTQAMNERRSREELEIAKARHEALTRQVELDVFRSFHEVRTALQKLSTIRDLLASATRAHEAGLARYKAGAGSILELLSAQSALEDARAQEVQAVTDWRTSLVRLARNSGTAIDTATPSAAEKR